MPLRKIYSALVLLPAFLLACSPGPKPIEYGSAQCEFCKMTIVDNQHAAEVVTQKGRAYFFDAIECMVPYVASKGEDQFAFLLVNDYLQPGKLIPAQKSVYLITQAIPSPMGAFLSAFSSEEKAKEMQAEKGGEVFKWEELKRKLE